MVTFTVSEEKNKLAKILAKQFPKMSYSNIHKLLRLKDVKVNGIRTSENGDVFKGDEIIVYVTDEMLKGKPLKFDVIYEDDNIIVVDKPVGVEVESESYNDLTGAVGSYLREKKQNAYPVHRLDRNTHGLVVFAKTKEALSELLLAF